MKTSTTYTSGLFFQRTPEEKRDRFLSWARPDKAFFASGACHILAYLFIELHQHEHYELIYIKPINNFSGTHIYVSNGTWAFDCNGWTLEKELLEETKKQYNTKYIGWDIKRMVLLSSIDDFCNEYHHRLPYQFAYLPWERAYTYIKQFPASPPLTI